MLRFLRFLCPSFWRFLPFLSRFCFFLALFALCFAFRFWCLVVRDDEGDVKEEGMSWVSPVAAAAAALHEEAACWACAEESSLRIVSTMPLASLCISGTVFFRSSNSLFLRSRYRWLFLRLRSRLMLSSRPPLVVVVVVVVALVVGLCLEGLSLDDTYPEDAWCSGCVRDLPRALGLAVAAGCTCCSPCCRCCPHCAGWRWPKAGEAAVLGLPVLCGKPGGDCAGVGWPRGALAGKKAGVVGCAAPLASAGATCGGVGVCCAMDGAAAKWGIGSSIPAVREKGIIPLARVPVLW